MNKILNIFFKTFEPEDSYLWKKYETKGMGIVIQDDLSKLINFEINVTKGENMSLIKVEDRLPEIGKDVICFGIDEDGETKVEEGFRSQIDKPDKLHDWIDFYFTVTHWVYSPVIEIE